MAGVACHAAVGVGAGGIIPRQLRGDKTIFVHEFRAHGFRAEVDVTRSDGVDSLNDFPFDIRIRHGTLIKFVSAPLETPLSPRRAENVERVAPCSARLRRIGSRGARSDKRGLLADGAMAIHAVNLVGGA